MTKFRWIICSLLFVATTVNYLDRQVLSLTWKDFIALDFHWNDNDYGDITATFSIFYAIISLFAGKFIDWMGTKKGYIWAIVIWSVGACLHAACGVATMSLTGIDNIEALRAVQKGSEVALTVSTISVWLFLGCRIILATGEAGNFPAAIKVTAEYFPKKDRAYATSIFNAGASVGALAAPLTIPLLAKSMGWEMAFIIIGSIGFIWAGAWLLLYTPPAKSKYVNKEELAYIESDKASDEAKTSDAAKASDANADSDGPKFSILDCFKYRQTWAFIVGKFMTDGVWWFFLFWAPAYFSELGYPSTSTMGQLLIFILYAIVTAVSIGGGYLPKIFVEKLGMNPYAGRMRAMLIFAFLPIFAMFAQPLASSSVWWPCIIIGLAGAGHQAWSANLYSTIGDMFPKSAIATITGIGTLFGGLCSFAINKCSGKLFTYAEGLGEEFSFFGVTGKPGAYMIVFCYCAVAYLLAWVIMKTLVPKYKPIEK
ncbi:MAG: MFS transporter [Bacteroidales bacterium]|jgi:ACS family hexuronate transporter-like MFS transporter|nr:MFS transporter [Bacteroidales bacterium]